MKTTNEDMELIEKYLDGSLSRDEEAAFEERLRVDSEFAFEFKKRQILQQAYVEASNRLVLKKQVQQILEKDVRTKKSKQYYWLAAASIVLMVGVGYLFYQQQFKTKDEIGFATNQKVEDGSVTPQHNEIEEYGKVDKIESNKKTSQLKDGTVLSSVDTIVLSRINCNRYDTLIITGYNGHSVVKYPIHIGSCLVKLNPKTLQPGSYYWRFKKEGNQKSIIVK